jgi:uncharacterized protein (TIRG00374 family)
MACGEQEVVADVGRFVGELLHFWSRLNPEYLAATIALYYITLLFYSLRLVVISSRLGLHMPLRTAYAAHLAGVTTSNILPSVQVLGEAAKAAYVRWRLGRGLPEVTAAIIYDKVVEAIPLASIVLAGLTSSTPRLHSYAMIIGVLSIALIVGALLLWEKIAEKASRALERRGYKIPREKLKSLIKDRELAAIVAGLAAATWLLVAARIYTACLAAGLHPTLQQTILLTLAYVAATAPSLTPGSIGIVEPTLAITIKELTGAPAEKALAATFAERTASYLAATATGLLVVAATGAWDIVTKPTRKLREQTQQQI